MSKKGEATDTNPNIRNNRITLVWVEILPQSLGDKSCKPNKIETSVTGLKNIKPHFIREKIEDLV